MVGSSHRQLNVYVAAARRQHIVRTVVQLASYALGARGSQDVHPKAPPRFFFFFFFFFFAAGFGAGTAGQS